MVSYRKKRPIRTNAVSITIVCSLDKLYYEYEARTNKFDIFLPGFRVSVIVFNATFNNVPVISWLSVLFGGGNRRKPTTYRKSLTKLYHITLHRVHLVWVGFELTALNQVFESFNFRAHVLQLLNASLVSSICS